MRVNTQHLRTILININMSSLHHEVTPTFNKAIYDSLLEVGTDLRQKPWSHEVDFKDPDPGIETEVGALFNNPTISWHDILQQLPEILQRYKKYTEDIMNTIHDLAAKSPQPKDVFDDVMNVIDNQSSTQQPASTAIRRTNLRSLPQPITKPL